MNKNVYIFKERGGQKLPYYLCSYRVKVHDRNRGIITIQRTLSTGAADRPTAQQRANELRKKDIARFYAKEEKAPNLHSDCPTCGHVVDLFLKHSTNGSSRNAARAFLTVVAEGALILGDEAGRRKAREIRLSELTDRHMLRFKKQEARLKANQQARRDATVDYYIRTARSIFTNKETYLDVNLPGNLHKWREDIALINGHSSSGYTQIPAELLTRMDARAKRYFLRIARWFARRAARPGREKWDVASDTRWANQFRNAHATYWLVRKCGLRNVEVEHLRWDWFERDENGLWLNLKKRYDASGRLVWKPKGREGSVPVSPRLYEELLTVLGPARPGLEGYVLAGTKDHRDDGTHRAPSKFCRKYLGGERDKSLYELRKQAGSEVALRDGIEAASKFLRHADLKTTWDYYIDLIKYRKTVKPL
jgi:integrase